MSDTIDKIAVDPEKKELLTRIQHTLDKIRPYICLLYTSDAADDHNSV